MTMFSTLVSAAPEILVPVVVTTRVSVPRPKLRAPDTVVPVPVLTVSMPVPELTLWLAAPKVMVSAPAPVLMVNALLKPVASTVMLLVPVTNAVAASMVVKPEPEAVAPTAMLCEVSTDSSRFSTKDTPVKAESSTLAMSVIWMVSVFAPPLMVCAPSNRASVSLKVSLKASPFNVWPAKPPTMVSSPPPPLMICAAAPPVMVSLPLLPLMVRGVDALAVKLVAELSETISNLTTPGPMVMSPPPATFNVSVPPSPSRRVVLLKVDRVMLTVSLPNPALTIWLLAPMVMLSAPLLPVMRSAEVVLAVKVVA